MALSSIAHPAHNTIRGVQFAMRDGIDLVPVLVTHAALEDVDGAGSTSASYLARFEQHRETFEQIAIAKHRRGQIEEGGSVTVQAADLKPTAG